MYSRPGHQYRDNGNTTNPFEERTPHINEYTAAQIATLQSRLDKQLGPEYISTRPGAGGGKVHYLAAEKVINLANEVLGFNGWSSEIKNVQIDFVDESTSGKISLGLSVISRVTLKDGAFHEDIGYGHIENCKGKAAAFEKAKKEAATDAMKRALRNFGNVLGNCLYDKDYLARVTKVKVAPSKWDAENLHRHPDFAPIKREAIAEVQAVTTSKAAPPARLQSTTSMQSNGTEYEDDYGGNLFDEVDFNHPDEVRLDDTPIRPGHNGPGAAQNRQAMNRVASMPALRTPNGMQHSRPQDPQQPQHPQQPSRPSAPPQRQPSTNGVTQSNQGHGHMMPPPNQIPPQVQRGLQQSNGVQSNVSLQQSGPQHSGPQPNEDGVRSNPSSASSTTQRGQSVDVGGRLTPPGEVDQAPPQAIATPQGIPSGFVSGNAASAFVPNSGNEPATIKMFDPHHESPSIRRTQGVDPRKSVPVRRSDIGAPPAPTPPKGPVNKGGAPSGGMAGKNFANPSMDPHRRIGAPGQMQSPMANRNAYKPPSILKRPAPADIPRPALTDVSNIQQAGDGSSDVKKQKIEPNVQPAQTDANGENP